MLRISTNGKQVVVYPPQTQARPYEPLTGQFVLNFEVSELAKKIHAMASRSAEEWFELGMAYDSESESLDQAEQAYGKSRGSSAGLGRGAHQSRHNTVSAGKK